MNMDPNSTTAAGVTTQPPRPPATETRSGIRGVFLVIWAIATVSLLAEYVLTHLDLRRSRMVAWALSSAVAGDELEPAGGSEGGRASPLESRVADLAAQVQAKDAEIARLKADIGRAEAKARDAAAEGRGGGTEAPAADRSSMDRGLPGGGTPAEGEELFAPDAGSDPPGASGRIIIRDPGSEFAAIDLGARDGIQRGMKLALRAGSQEIGSFLVLDVRNSVSAGRIVTGKGQAIDDEVRVER